MSGDTLIKVEGVSKKFCRDLKRSLRYGIQDIITEFLGLTRNYNLRKKEFWAVKDVNFQLKRGECLGLIGHNGAGKSTLLKMLNGLIKPDQGIISMKGRISALIELGAGFNPILTGRENVYNNGAVLGFTQKEIESKYNAIVDFAELKEFMDTPVQNYSSGMKVRLGFAVAAQMEPDVLIIDEVLAVGDVGFKAKCMRRIGELQNSCAIIFVSHGMSQISRLSTTLIYLNHGKIAYKGQQLSEGIDLFLNAFATEKFRVSGDVDSIQIEKLLINNKGAFQKELELEQFQKVNIDFTFRSNIQVNIYAVAFSLTDNELKGVAVLTDVNNRNKFLKQHGQIHVTASFKNNLAPGIYYLSIHINKFDNGRAEYLTELRQIATLTVSGNHIYTLIPVHFDTKFGGTLYKENVEQ